MSDFLLELFFEEIPAFMQVSAEVGYKKIFMEYFQGKNINYQEIKVFSTPRRVTIYIKNINSVIDSQLLEIKGPKITAAESAIQGFCRSNDITIAELDKNQIGDQLFYVYKKIIPPQKIETVLANDLPEIIKKYVWAKSMYWDTSEISAIRPLRNILCMLDEQVIFFKYGNLLANNKTYGHRTLGQRDIEINTIDQYFTVLADNFVILDSSLRKEIINRQINEILGPKKLTIKQDELLLQEIVGLVEWPVVMVGDIKEKFLQLPQEILITTMRNHQKYLSVIDEQGNFVPKFLFVSNMQVKDQQVIINGNERVLDARLNDALYFYNQDIANNFKNLDQKLSGMIFHVKLGSMLDKVTRIKKIAKYLEPNNQNLDIAAEFCKHDLATYVVSELPELQGIMGYYYVQKIGFNEKIAQIIKDHYLPIGPNSMVPTKEAAILALSDKIDSLVGLIIAGCMPTGSKDPFALRRLAIGVIRIIIENKINLDVVQLISFTAEQYVGADKKNIDSIVYFLEDRLKYFLKNQYDLKIINAVLDIYNNHNISDIALNIQNLNIFLQTKQGEDLKAIYKRFSNILSKNYVASEVRQDLFTEQIEHILYKNFINVEKEILNQHDFLKKLEVLTELIEPINEFFAKVMINDSDTVVAGNRLNLLHNIKIIFNKVIKFDEL